MRTEKRLVEVKRQLPKRIISPEVRKQALACFEQGLGWRQTGRMLGLSEYTVRDWHRAFRSGTFRIEVAESLRCYDEQTKRTAVALRKAGLTWKSFEEQTGIPRATCMSWMRNQGKPSKL